MTITRRIKFFLQWFLVLLFAVWAKPAAAQYDLVWQQDSGVTTQHLRDGQTVAGRTLSGPTSWRAVDVDDVNGDGYPDIVWQHRTSGAVAVHYLRDGHFLNDQVLSGPTAWRLVTTADMNGDRHRDLIWQSRAGQVAVHYLQHGQFIGDRVLMAPTADRLVSAADIDQDGQVDLVLRGPDGSLSVRYVHEGEVTGSDPLHGPKKAWRVRDVLDLNGDQSPDLIAQNKSDGRVRITYMNGLTTLDRVIVTGPTQSTLVSASVVPMTTSWAGSFTGLPDEVLVFNGSTFYLRSPDASWRMVGRMDGLNASPVDIHAGNWDSNDDTPMTFAVFDRAQQCWYHAHMVDDRLVFDRMPDSSLFQLVDGGPIVFSPVQHPEKTGSDRQSFLKPAGPTPVDPTRHILYQDGPHDLRDHGLVMGTNIHIEPNGRITGTTTTHEKTYFIGGTGSVIVTLFKGEDPLWTKTVWPLGVDGRACLDFQWLHQRPCGRTSRVDVWADDIPEMILRQADGIAVSHQHAAKALDVWGILTGVANSVKKIVDIAILIVRIVNGEIVRL